ncbi:gephyrin-like molybdotransferase Glp [Halomonas salinarum]|uniref:molybdopterin molybdotransferase MoeA n=1 Tax=Halomonas salinarum TaxID=1158993 RepID=UPI00143C3B8F|nr:gephyrin-like molybdotransferase Glp [Halomonas salinarum]
MADTSSELQRVEDALAALLEGVTPVAPETIDCDAAAGRVLAEDVAARLDVPSFDNSAMDGYALRASDAGQWLAISQRIPAGSQATPLMQGTCARIFTGSELPAGADCVVMQERVALDGDSAWIPGDIPSGDNVRLRGRDVSVGAKLLTAGVRLEAASLGHLAGQGITRVSVRRRPRVALLSTGDEIIEPGESLAPGQIYNSNRPMLRRLIERFGGEVVMAKRVADDFATTCKLLGEAAAQADVVITTGGVSVGEEDHVKAALEKLGQLDLWRLAMRPGKPLALGRLPTDTGEARLIGLPGNPVSSYVGAWIYLRPLLGAMLGSPALAELPQLRARAEFSTETKARRHYMRVELCFLPEGPSARAFSDQNSAVLSSCVTANALAVIPAHSRVAPGDMIDCLWLTEA